MGSLGYSFLLGEKTKHGFNPMVFFFRQHIDSDKDYGAAGGNPTKNGTEAEQTLNFNLDLCLGRKSRMNSSIETRCNLETLELRTLRQVFTVNKSNKEAQTEKFRSTKILDAVYRIALAYERLDNYAKTYQVSSNLVFKLFEMSLS